MEKLKEVGYALDELKMSPDSRSDRIPWDPSLNPWSSDNVRRLLCLQGYIIWIPMSSYRVCVRLKGYEPYTLLDHP